MLFSYCFCFYQSLHAVNIIEKDILTEEFFSNMVNITE